jgi:hypothetical protein
MGEIRRKRSIGHDRFTPRIPPPEFGPVHIDETPKTWRWVAVPNQFSGNSVGKAGVLWGTEVKKEKILAFRWARRGKK